MLHFGDHDSERTDLACWARDCFPYLNIYQRDLYFITLGYEGYNFFSVLQIKFCMLQALSHRVGSNFELNKDQSISHPRPCDGWFALVQPVKAFYFHKLVPHPSCYGP